MHSVPIDLQLLLYDSILIVSVLLRGFKILGSDILVWRKYILEVFGRYLLMSDKLLHLTVYVLFKAALVNLDDSSMGIQTFCVLCERYNLEFKT